MVYFTRSSPEGENKFLICISVDDFDFDVVVLYIQSSISLMQHHQDSHGPYVFKRSINQRGINKQYTRTFKRIVVCES